MTRMILCEQKNDTPNVFQQSARGEKLNSTITLNSNKSTDPIFLGFQANALYINMLQITHIYLFKKVCYSSNLWLIYPKTIYK